MYKVFNTFVDDIFAFAVEARDRAEVVARLARAA